VEYHPEREAGHLDLQRFDDSLSMLRQQIYLLLFSIITTPHRTVFLGAESVHVQRMKPEAGRCCAQSDRLAAHDGEQWV
jgi:hypothetical protein